MKFFTEVNPKPSPCKISHGDKILLAGSCFAENIGRRFERSGFEVCINPFGIAYNPLSICDCIKRVAKRELFVEEELVKIGDYWKSYSHHGDFRSENRQECLQMINTALANAHSFLANARFVILTLGTAWIYSLKENGKLLANCHKLPSQLIDRSLCSIERVASSLEEAFETCRSLNPSVQFILTISPIRHWREGYRDNMLSKSVLHLATEEFCRNTSSIYFPSYEIMMDELRDYRFYADDMLHPGEKAENYIWEKFQQTFFSKETICLAGEFEKLDAMLSHRPFNPQSEQYKQHLQKAEKLKQELNEKLGRKQIYD